MGFLDRIFGGKVFPDKREPALACELRILEGSYLLDEFDITFGRGHATEKFAMYAVTSEAIGGELESWITKGTSRESGEIRFYKNVEMLGEGMVHQIKFSDAICLKYRKSATEGIPTTTIVFECRKINMAGEECEIV